MTHIKEIKESTVKRALRLHQLWLDSGRRKGRQLIVTDEIVNKLNFKKIKNFSGANFSQANFSYADFSEKDMRDMNFKEAVRKQMTKNRKAMNTKDGFWTIALRGEYQKEFLEVQYKITDVKRCLLFSDGFERIFEHSLYSYSDILSQKVDLSTVTKQLRDWEDKAVDLDVKRHDDVSAILVEF